MHTRFARASACALALLVMATLTPACRGADADEWAKRTIYQLLTDRFAGPSPPPPCENLNDYCGGTFAGIVSQLEYIKGMGFDAIWFSPVVTNTVGGYHGYWAQDFNTINSFFGTSAELVALVDAIHSLGMLAMFDIVANHCGPIGLDFGALVPYNTSAAFHPLCEVTEYTCFTDEVYTCRLDGLPDLNQDGNAAVASSLLAWVRALVADYGVDGIRADTVMYIEPSFWVDFSQAAGVYVVGEVESSVECCASYQTAGAVSGTLSYPMYWTLLSVFQQGQSMTLITGQLEAYRAFSNVTLLGTFVDNHDNARFLSGCSNCAPAYLNALLYVLFADGIPIVYYGTEQGFDGGAPPACRETLWPSDYATTGDYYLFFALVVPLRQAQTVWAFSMDVLVVQSDLMVFARGTTVVCVVNTGSSVSAQVAGVSVPNGTRLCNVFSSGDDCVLVENGAFELSMGEGLPKIYVPEHAARAAVAGRRVPSWFGAQ